MQNTFFSRKFVLGSAGIVTAAASMLLTGCGISAVDTAAPIKVAGVSLAGSVHGGQQPVAGSAVQLYAANLTGYGNASYTLLTSPVTTNSTGGFGITGLYTCPSSTTPVYIVATGGNPGLGGTVNNTNLAMMAALGPCGNLSSASFININELTTIASAYALAPFMSSIGQVASSAANAQGLTNAFATVNKLVNVASGSVSGPALPAGATIPTAELNTLADILASCINTAGGTGNCATLFTAATPPGGTAPTDTIAAALDIAKFPSNNAATLLGMTTPNSPFQPTLATASSFAVSIRYATGGFSTPSASAVDASGNVWITNSGNNTVTVLAPTGAPVVGSPYGGGGLSGPSGIAIDIAGNAWITDKTSSKLSVFTPSGVGTQSAGTGMAAPTGVSIDGTGTIWVSNSGSNSVTGNYPYTAGGTVIGVSYGFLGSGITSPTAVVINPN